MKPTLFIFDEPTTGLHFHDIKNLLNSFNALLMRNHTILIVEHNLEVIKSADWIIDLGPEGGDKGGICCCIRHTGRNNKCNNSYTAHYLKRKADFIRLLKIVKHVFITFAKKIYEQHKDNSIISDLFSNVDTVVLDTLNEISNSGRVHFIPVIAELLHTTENIEIKNSIVKIFSELKQTAAVPVMVETIKNKKFENELELIVRSCWENGLDYSTYILDFAELLNNTANYMTAFESYYCYNDTEGDISKENAG
jgi:ABC-type multidrug transport system ATPase subunit